MGGTTRVGALLGRLVALAAVVAALGAAFGVPAVARAETYGPTCSAAALIAAINSANSSPGASRIALSQGCVYTLTTADNDSGNGPNGLPLITAVGGPLTIVGYGATIARDTGGATPNFRLFEVAPGASLTLIDVTLTGGNSDDGTGLFSGTNRGGGAIRNEGALTVVGGTLSGNTAGLNGGAIDSYGTLTIRRSAIVDNIALDDGGGVAVQAGTALIESTSILDNEAATPILSIGGGVWTLAGSTTTLNNVTVADNVARGAGNQLYTDTTGAFTLSNSIIYDTVTSSACNLWPGAFFADGGNNLVYDSADPTDCGFGTETNPALGSRTGSPPYRPLNGGSPAINTGGACASTDQRSIFRRANGSCDIGAAEFGDGTATIDFGDPGLSGLTGALAEAGLNSAYNARGVSFDALRDVLGELGTNGSNVTVYTDPAGADMLITFAYPVEFVSVNYVVTDGQRNGLTAREGTGTAATIENSDDPLVDRATTFATGQLALSGQCIRTLQVENESVSFVFDDLTFRPQAGKDADGNGIVDACDYTAHVVTTTADTGPGSLYQAILDANAEPDRSLISFNIPGAGDQLFTGTTPRPQITGPTKIDGYTQPGSSRNTLAQGWNGVTLIELNGNVGNTVGLEFGPGSAGSIVRGLQFSAHSDAALRISAPSVLVTGNMVGTDEAGADTKGNATGIDVAGGANTRLGGPTPSQRNVITGNANRGILLSAGGGTVENNYIGTTPAGEEPASLLLYNGNGVELQNTSATIRGNVISNNVGRGILVSGAGASGTAIAGNIIGLNAVGMVGVRNNIGVELTGGAAGVTVGGATPADRNVIASSTDPDVVVRDTADGNTIRGNYIGVDATGNAGFASLGFLTDGSTMLIEGDTTLVDNNVISAAQGSTLKISSGNNNTLTNNLIGTNAAGNTGLGTVLYGVEIVGSSANNLVGTPGQGNLIAGNGAAGVVLDGPGVTGTTLRGNRIGITAAGVGIGNGSSLDSHGVLIENGAAATTVGGTTAAARNIIAGNTGDGIHVSSAGSGTVIAGNYIGVDSSGVVAVGNQADGVEVANTGGVTIGGATAAAGNVIGGNGDNGIWIQGIGAGNVIRNNRIGLGADDTADVGNASFGVLLFPGAGGFTVSDNTLANGNYGLAVFSDNNTITGNTISGNTFSGMQLSGASNIVGGTTLAARNVIVGNGQGGINITGSSAAGNIVQGNYIGVRADDTPDGNALSGIALSSGANGNTIGGAAPGAGNLIAYNGSGLGIDGVLIDSSNNTVEGNVIRDNARSGVRVLAGRTNNRLLSNLVYANGGGNITLLGNANGGLPAPTVTTVAPGVPADGQTNVQGWVLTGAPATQYTVQLFSGATCAPGGAAEARALLQSFEVTTDAGGAAPFTRDLSGNLAPGTFVSAIATSVDPGGAGSTPMAICAPVTPDNTTWYQALPLAGFSASASQPIALSEQVRWYYMEAGPQSRLAVTLSNLPAGYDVALFNDLDARAKELVAQAGADVDTAVALAQTATDYDAIEASNFITNSLAPEIYSPEAYTSLALDPTRYRSAVLADTVVSPFKISPFKISPFKISPFKISPFKISPFKISPFKISPFKISDLAGSVVDSGLLAYTDLEGTQPRTLTLNTYTDSGRVYIAVYGRNGAFDPTQNFTLTASKAGAACLDVAAPDDTYAGLAAVGKPNGGYTTLFLTDLSRLPGTQAEKDALVDRVDTYLRTRSEVDGAPLVNLANDARVRQANATADANRSCPEAKNLVANEIKALVERYRAANSKLSYVVLIGGDEVIPYYRYADQALLGNESEFRPPVDNASSAEAALRLGYILGQDEYGARFSVTFRSTTLAIPDLAVGRLVETAGEALTMVQRYLDTGGLITPPTSAITPASFVSGYDFHYDSASAIAQTLAAGTGAPVATLLSPSTESYQAPGSWTAGDLRAKLAARGYSLYYLAGHFSDGALKAADYATYLRASDLEGEPSFVMAGALVVSPGCHSGYNTPDQSAIQRVTEQPDWAQFFARRGTALIAGTGFQYGDTAFTQFAEELYARYFEQLRIDADLSSSAGDEVAIGKALVVAKQRYLLDSAVIRGIDKKTLTISTLFGLPMARVNLRGERLGPQPPPAIPAELNPQPLITGDPYTLKVDTVTVTPTLGLATLDLTTLNPDGSPGAPAEATYVHGATPDAVVARPGEPVLPLVQYSAGVQGEQLRGALYLTGTYTLKTDVLPLTGAPATELRGVHITFPSEAFYPEKWWVVNALGELTGETTEARNQLQLTPAQFLADPGSIRGKLRYYSGQQQFRLFYSNGSAANVPNQTADTFDDLDPGLYGAPAIPVVTFARDGAQVKFQVSANGGGVPLREVWVTFTADAGPLFGKWQSLKLEASAADPSLYLGAYALPQGTQGFSFFVQAANAAGFTALNTNLGLYYQAGGLDTNGAVTLPPPPPVIPPAANATATAIDLGLPAGATYGRPATFTAQLSAGSAGLAGQPLTLRVGSQTATATTGATGQATFVLTMFATGEQPVEVAYGGTSAYEPSADTAALAVAKQQPTLVVSPANLSMSASMPFTLTATLTDLDGGIRDARLYLRLGGEVYTGRTGPEGVLRLPLPALAAGSYPFTVTFLRVPTADGGFAAETDARYLEATATGSLTVDNGLAANDQALTTSEDTALRLTLDVANPTGAALTYRIVGGPARGTLSGTAPTLTYTPTANFAGVDSFSYEVCLRDAPQQCDQATVTIGVSPVNDAPTLAIAPVSLCLADFSGRLNLALTDPDNAPGELTLSGRSSNALLVPAAGITVGGSNASRTVTIATAAGRSGTAVVTLTVSDGAASVDLALAVKAGTSQGETLTGSLGPSILFGGAGNDTLLGGPGADLLCGGQGRDQLDGGLGLDSLDGGDLGDSLAGGLGDDTLTGGAGDDTLDGGLGNDTLTGGAGSDALSGGAGEDVLRGGLDNDNLDGGLGSDQLFGEQGNDRLTGGFGADAFDGGPGTDSATDFNSGQGDTRVNIP